MTGILSNETKSQTIITIKQLFWDTVNKMYRAYDLDGKNQVASTASHVYLKADLTSDTPIYVYNIPLGTGVRLKTKNFVPTPGPMVAGEISNIVQTNEKAALSSSVVTKLNFDGKLLRVQTNDVPSNVYIAEEFGSMDELIRDTPSIGFPLDNDAQDLTTLGEVGEQKDWGQMKIDGKLDKWKSDGRYEATTLGKVWSNLYLSEDIEHCGYPQVVNGGCMFKRIWNAPVFRIKIFKNNRDYTDKPVRNRVPKGTAEPDHGDELRIYNGVRFLNWTPTEDQARIKESLSFSVEDITVIGDYEIPYTPDEVEAEYQPSDYNYIQPP